MSTGTALTLDLRLGDGRQLCYFLRFWCILLQIHLLPVALPAVQLHTAEIYIYIVGPLCIPSTSQTLERVKGNLRTKSCLPLRPEIQITQGVAGPGVPRDWERLGVPQGGRAGPRSQGRALQPGSVPEAQPGSRAGQGVPGTAPAPRIRQPWGLAVESWRLSLLRRCWGWDRWPGRD